MTITIRATFAMSYRQVAAVAGFETATLRLTAGCSPSASLMILPSIIPTANPRPNIVLPLRRQMTTLLSPPPRQGTACHDDTAGAPSGQPRTGSPPINPGPTSTGVPAQGAESRQGFLSRGGRTTLKSKNWVRVLRRSTCEVDQGRFSARVDISPQWTMATGRRTTRDG